MPPLLYAPAMVGCLSVVFASAGLGSLGGSLLVLIFFGSAGQGVLFDFRFGAAMACFSLFFTIPGSLMLVGLNARIVEAGWSVTAARLIVFTFGAVAGATILTFGNATISNAAIGVAYGGTTALAVIALTALQGRAAI